jgi:GntR family transcriptional regulator
LDIMLADAKHTIDALHGPSEDARAFRHRPRLPAAREYSLTTGPASVPVEWSDDRYLGSAVAFSVHNSIAVNALSRTLVRSDPTKTSPRRQ